MPNTREKLIELFEENNVRCDHTIERLADYVNALIANGVTVLDKDESKISSMSMRKSVIHHWQSGQMYLLWVRSGRNSGAKGLCMVVVIRKL